MKETVIVIRMGRKWYSVNLVDLLAYCSQRSKSDIKRLFNEGAIELFLNSYWERKLHIEEFIKKRNERSEV